MAQQEECKEAATKSSNPKAAGSTCEVCKTNPSKYKCPGCCVIVTCSLPCVEAHKQSTGCNGKDSSPSSLLCLNLMIIFSFLIIICLRMSKELLNLSQIKRAKLCGDSQRKVPFPLKSLAGAAASRRTKILFLATGMSKRQTNQYFYDYRVDDNTSLSSVIMNHLEPGPFNHRNHCSLSNFLSKHLQRYIVLHILIMAFVLLEYWITWRNVVRSYGIFQNLAVF